MMKMLQKILSHGLLIAVIVAAFFIYTNRADLLPSWFGEAETTQAARVDKGDSAQPVEPGATTPAIKPGDAVDSTSDKAVSVEPAVSEAGQAVTESTSVSGPEPELESEQQSSSAGIRSADMQDAVKTPVYHPLQSEEADKSAVEDSETDVGVSEVPAESAQPAEHVVDSSVPEEEVSLVEQQAAPGTPDVAAMDTSTGDKAGEKTLQKQLEEARQFYWQSDISAATEAYEALGHDYPRNADVWGEIGNFYYSTRQSQPAGMAYYRTVSLLIDTGDTQKARQLLGVLYELDANRGRELDARLQQSAE